MILTLIEVAGTSDPPIAVRLDGNDVKMLQEYIEQINKEKEMTVDALVPVDVFYEGMLEDTREMIIKTFNDDDTVTVYDELLNKTYQAEKDVSYGRLYIEEFEFYDESEE